jgi:DNA-3-methyladenine glycosylase
LQSEELFIADDGLRIDEDNIAVTPRIGVDYAGEDALLPYRFIVEGSNYISGKAGKKSKFSKSKI